MRRLVKHGIAGVAFAAFTVTTAVAALGSPAGLDTAIAVPAPLVSITPSATPAASNPALPAEAAARGERESREATRAQLTAAAALQASNRATTLSKQVAAVTAQQQQIQAEQAKAKAAQAKARVKARAAQAKAEAAQAKAAAEAKARAEVAAKAAAAAAKAAAAAQERVIKNRGYEPGTTDPRSMAKQILANKYNYGADQYSCFNYIIMRESMWKVTARNSSSGAYGIPQALPGSKMATVASDWRTNPATQIIWGIEYMKDRYGSPCAAKGFKASHGWY